MTYDSGIRHKDFKFKGDVMECKGKDTGWRIHRDLVENHMFWIQFPDKTYSADYYNFTRCKENMKELYMSEANGMSPEAPLEAVGAFK